MKDMVWAHKTIIITHIKFSLAIWKYHMLILLVRFGWCDCSISQKSLQPMHITVTPAKLQGLNRYASVCCHKKQQITTNSTSIDIFICYTTMHNTINNFQGFGLHPGHYHTYTLHRTYKKTIQ